MKHAGTKVLETERLALRRFALGDAEAMFKNWAGDPDVTKFLTWPAHVDIGVSEGVCKEWDDSYARDDYYCWAIVPKIAGEPVGSISVVKYDDDLQTAHMGYCIGKKWWGQGMAAEALEAVIRFLFETVGVNRVESRYDPNNPNSGKVMLKCGMKYEGTLRQSARNNQGLCDASWHAILAEDYFFA